jgi:multidrug efflux pump
MSLSRPFILRPVGTTLLAIGLFLVGTVAFILLPVASLPSVDFPTIRVSVGRPGADPETMAATVAAPLERRLGEIGGLTELTSTSALGSSAIIAQFDLSRNIDGAARDVQAALNAAATDLPADLPALPIFRKFNPSAMPVLILALTSQTMQTQQIYDIADSVLAQRLAQVDGVADVTVNGAEQPALRIRVDPARLAGMGLSIDTVRTAIVNANVAEAVGGFDGGRQTETIATTDQIRDPEDFRRIIVGQKNGIVIRLGDVATVEPGVRNTQAAGWYDHKPAVLIYITKQATANVIDTIDRVKALIPEFANWAPAGLDVSVLTDRSVTIRASVAEIERALVLSIVLVMIVVFVFLRRATPTIAAGVTVPLSLAGTAAAMWAAKFAIDNISLMAITVAVGFVVDDAIVMIENIHRNMELGMGRMQAAIVGAGQIGFTVISISLSLIAAFIPILFIGGIPGRVFFEFSATLTFAILISTAISLTVTPMICGQFMKATQDDRATWFDRLIEGGLDRLVTAYSWTLSGAMKRPLGMTLVMIATIGITVDLYRTTPKGAFPQDDTGLVQGFTEAAPDVSFAQMEILQQRAADVILADPAVDHMASFLGNDRSLNQGQFNINLKPEAVRNISTPAFVDRLRPQLQKIAGIGVFLTPLQDLRAGGRPGKSPYQFTLWDPNLPELVEWAPKIVARLQELHDLVDVSTDRNPGGLDAHFEIDRPTASRLGVQIQAIDNVLNDAFGQRQISTIYTQRNNYKVVFEVVPNRRRDANDITGLFVPGANATQVPLSALGKLVRGTAALLVNHQGQFPSITVTFDIPPGVQLDPAEAEIEQAVAELHLPEGLHTEFAGDAKASNSGTSNMGVLLLVAVLAVYVILGVLYESLIHPITIISTLPSAGLGALIALNVAGMPLSIIAFIGIILLIGIVKKNGIMMVDFAIAAERDEGLSPADAIHKACLVRFRPILMTTLAALLGAIPLVTSTGPGATLRQPLGVTIVGGLALSQLLTLYTTPMIYLFMNKFRRRKAKVPRLMTAIEGAVAAPGE